MNWIRLHEAPIVGGLVEMGFLNFVRSGASLARPFGVRGSSAITKVINRNTATESRNNRRYE